jgi:hypothetical protein
MKATLRRIPKEPPPLHRSVRAFTPAKTGRPPKWCGLLRGFLAGESVKQGPYKNEPTAIAAAGWFNSQMRDHAPKEYERGIRFRGKSRFVIIKQVDI